MIARVVVTPKAVVNDPQGLTVKQALGALGFDEVEDVRVGKYIEVRLDSESEETAGERVEQMCRRLLANHVIEDYRFAIHGENQGSPHGPPSLQSDAGNLERDSDGAGDPPLPSDVASGGQRAGT